MTPKGSTTFKDRQPIELTKSFARLPELVREYGLTLCPDTLKKYTMTASLLLEANLTTNLTRVTDPEKMVVVLYLDSLLFVKHLPQEKTRLLDIGTGAGFPAIPIALQRPDVEVTAIDGRHKKTDFIKQVTRTVSIRNLHAVHARSESFKAPLFDIVTAKAVAPLTKTVDLLIPHIRTGGRGIIACSLAAWEKTAKKMNHTGITFESHPYRLPDYSSHFTHLIINKI
jgi:16S rRNA (guanine527-N7)-methyltransferase